MAKTANLGLELTTDNSTAFEAWRKAQNGQGVGTVIDPKSNAQIIDEFAEKFLGGAANQYYKKNSSEKFDGKWETADSFPTADSNKLVTSGGANNAISKAVSAVDNGSKVTVTTIGNITQELSPDVFYDFTGALTSLVLTFGIAVTGRENEYKGQFLSGATVPTVTFPIGISWIGGVPTIKANKTYQFSILNGIGVIVGV